jgi:hypothetical protein
MRGYAIPFFDSTRAPRAVRVTPAQQVKKDGRVSGYGQLSDFFFRNMKVHAEEGFESELEK